VTLIAQCHTACVTQDHRWLPPLSTTPTAAPEPSYAPAPPSGPASKSSAGKRAAGPVALLIAIAAKAKFLLLALPKLKLLTTSGTMLVSVAAYSLIWGWKFALGFVVLLLVHEMGHVIQLRREGIEASAPMFIPFLGAVVSAKSLGDDALAEARVGLAGPILGTIGAAAVLPLYWLTGNELWLALAFTGFFLNLFNLLPVVPLDGGRAMAALSPWMWFVGLFAMALLAFAYPNPVIILILLLAVYETYKRWKARKAGGDAVQAYYRVKPAHRLAILGVYLGLIIVCAVGMGLTFVERSIPA
jgi:Zn-dependent protease